MEKSPSKYLETENKGMNSNIYQIILDNILSLEMKQWDKIVFYSQYDEDSYEMKFYVKQNGMYTDCFSLGFSVDIFIEIDKELAKSRSEFEKENEDIWKVMTIVFNSDFKFKTFYDYSYVSDDVISYKRAWKKKYLI